MKKFSKFEISAIKNTAKSVNHFVTKKNKLQETINKLQQEWDLLDQTQMQYEAPIKAMTGGYTTEDLIDKVIEDTNSVDKNGKIIRVTKFVLKYPDSVIPNITVDDNIEHDLVDDSNLEEVEHIAGNMVDPNTLG